jgi:hypothetical protein
LFRILISDERAGNLFSVAVICAFNEKAHASTGATESTIFIPILPADLPEIALFYIQEKLGCKLPSLGIAAEVAHCFIVQRTFQHYRFAFVTIPRLRL